MKPLALKPTDAFELIGVGTTKGYELLNSGELEAFKIGRGTRITTASIEAYVERQIASSTKEAA